jgi:DNA (cytosine-5)-methyltransferase 1
VKFIDLFCGIGGFHQALARLGMECVFACDLDPACRRSYEDNYGLEPASDIREVEPASLPDFDALCGGFPCQAFSKAGRRMGFSDERGNLFFSICRIAEAKRPSYMILENVRNLASHDGGNTWRVIRDSIEALGYQTYEDPLILNALDFGVPQNRERVIILCKRADLGPMPERPRTPRKRPRTSLSSIVDPSAGGRLEGKMRDVCAVWDAFVRILVGNSIPAPKFPVWTDWWDGDGEGTSSDTPEKKSAFYEKYRPWIDKNRDFYASHRSLLDPWLGESRANPNWFGAVRKFEWQAGDFRPDDAMDKVLWTARGSGIRVKRPDYAPTLVALSQVPVYGPLGRRLTARELLRLQSFPDSFRYEDRHVYRQVGNAVNVRMIERCARFLVMGEPLFGSESPSGGQEPAQR